MVELWPNGALGGTKVAVTEKATEVMDKGSSATHRPAHFLT